MTTMSLRRTFEHHVQIPAAPAAVFPLLCPVREYEWVPGWSCELLFTASGVAEKGAIFRTDSPSGQGRMTWVMSAYEPAERIEFSCVATDGLVMRLGIGLQGRDGGTALRWTREYTATGAEGAAWLAALRAEDIDARTDMLLRRLSHFAQTGTMLKTA